MTETAADSRSDFLRAAEQLIEDFRWARGEQGTPEYRVYSNLKIVAAELRARAPEAPGQVILALEERIAFVERSKTRLGYDANKLRALAEEVMGRWPVIRLALEKQGDGR